MKITKKQIKEIIKEELENYLTEDLKDYSGPDYKDYEYSKKPLGDIAKKLMKITDIYASQVGSYLGLAGDFIKPGMTVALNKYLYEKLKKSKADQGHKGAR